MRVLRELTLLGLSVVLSFAVLVGLYPNQIPPQWAVWSIGVGMGFIVAWVLDDWAKGSDDQSDSDGY